jgi:hypothetical protein
MKGGILVILVVLNCVACITTKNKIQNKQSDFLTMNFGKCSKCLPKVNVDSFSYINIQKCCNKNFCNIKGLKIYKLDTINFSIIFKDSLIVLNRSFKNEKPYRPFLNFVKKGDLFIFLDDGRACSGIPTNLSVTILKSNNEAFRLISVLKSL